MKLYRTNHIAVICSDYEKSKDFYVNILGFKIIKETFKKEGKFYNLDLTLGGLYKIELFSSGQPLEKLSYTEAIRLKHLAFQVDDIERSIKELIDRDIITEPIKVDEKTKKRFIFFNDPDDLPIELYEK